MMRGMMENFRADSARRPWALGEIVSWSAIIVTIVALLVLRVALHKDAQAAEARAAEEKPGLQVLLAGRYIVGVREVFPDKKAISAARLDDSLASAAKVPADKFRAAIVKGEFEGKEAALRDVEALQAETPALKADADILRHIYAGIAPVNEPDWQDFERRHGWFADLAASFGKPSSDPLREAAMKSAMRTMVVMIASFFFALGAFGVGLILLIVGIVLWKTRKTMPAFGKKEPMPINRAPEAEGFAFYLVGMMGLPLLFHYAFHLAFPWTLLSMPLAFVPGIIWPLVRGQSWNEWRMALGLHAGRGIFRELGCGALGYIAGLPIFAAGLVVTIILIKLTGADATHPITQEISADPIRLLELLLLASVWAPITEELMFRGSLFAHLRERWGWWPSALVVSVVFASIHPQGLVALPLLGSLAMVLAAIREWRGSILGCMMAHAINNTMALVVVTLMIS
jgi:membrane protease YdiL (CAAX protease family)